MYNVHVYCPNYVVLIVGIDKKMMLFYLFIKTNVELHFKELPWALNL